MFVSTTSFRRAPFLSGRFDFGGDVSFRHRVAGLRADSFEHVFQLGSGLAAAQLGVSRSVMDADSSKPVALASLANASGKSTWIVILMTRSRCQQPPLTGQTGAKPGSVLTNDNFSAVSHRRH